MKHRQKKVLVCVNAYNSAVEEERLEVIDSLKKLFSSNLEFAVIGANITRQVFLARQFSQNPNLWTPHLAPAFLRCMYEIGVRIMWLVHEPEKHCKAFVKASVSETKQYADTVSRTRKLQPERQELDEVEAAIDEWLEIQASNFEFTDGGKCVDVRKMAEKLQGEALKMYRLYNSSLSPAVHSSWNFIEQVNLTYSSNALHRFIRIPKIEFPSPSIDYFLSTAYFADQSLQIGRGSSSESSAFEVLMSHLNECFDDIP